MAYYYNSQPPYYQPNYYGNNGATPDMLNQMKVQYQPPQQPQPVQMPTQPTNQANNDIVWVQGEAGAKAFLVAPNNTVTLWDSESDTIYIKRADMNGVPSMRILDFKERNAEAPTKPVEHTCKCGDKFITKEAFATLEAKYDELRDIVEEIKSKPVKKATKTEE